MAAHSEEPIACHKTIQVNDEWEGARQCRGAAIYRANVCKLPRSDEVVVGPVDRESVFATPSQFIEHHAKNKELWDAVKGGSRGDG